MGEITRKLYITACLSLFVLFSAVDAGLAERSDREDLLKARRARVYEHVISPWVDKWFKDHSLEVNLIDNVKIRRRLLDKDLYKVDVVEGRDLYTVRVLYLVNINDRPANIKVWGLKEQKIVFWVDGFRLKDYFPAEDRWKERPYLVKTTDAVSV